MYQINTHRISLPYLKLSVLQPPVIVGRLTNNLNLNTKNTHFNYQPMKKRGSFNFQE